MLSQGEQMLKNLQSFPSQLVGKKRKEEEVDSSEKISDLSSGPGKVLL